MSLSVPNYPGPYATTPIPAAYVWIPWMVCDFKNGTERIKAAVHPDAASADAGLAPIETIDVVPGEPLVDGTSFRSLSAIMAVDPQFAQAFGYIRGVLYADLAKLPRFAGATEVP